MQPSFILPRRSAPARRASPTWATSTVSEGFPFTVWAVNTAWAAKNRPTLLAYVKAYGRAIRWLYDPSNKEKAVDILVKYSKQDPQRFCRHLRLLRDQAQGVQRRWIDQRGHLQEDD